MTPSEFHREVTQDQQYNVHLELGRVYESQKEYTAAVAEYEKSLEACTRRGFGAGLKGAVRSRPWLIAGSEAALDRLGRFAQAEDHYRLALKASPDDPKVWNDSVTAITSKVAGPMLNGTSRRPPSRLQRRQDPNEPRFDARRRRKDG